MTLEEHALSTELRVTNTSTTDKLEFQALFHNYIRAPADQVLVYPLQNYRYYDKTEASEEGRNIAKTETRVGVDVRAFTDSVYEDAPGTYRVGWPGGEVGIATAGLKDVVVWNPQEEGGRKMGDMEAGGWCVRMLLCDEGANLMGVQGAVCVCRAGTCEGICRSGVRRDVDWAASFVGRVTRHQLF